MSAHHTSSYHLHVTRVILWGFAVLAIGLTRVNLQPPVISRPAPSPQPAARVLAYATNINQTDLYNGTNAARSQNGLGNFNLSSQLSTSAQLKANDMIAKNYWSHTAPDGTQPWYWFTQAGYDYTAAGENLAYGFDDSAAVINAWMNSAGHRANILGDYKDVGFGIANGENYQGGQNTVVVAHYGTARTSTPAPAPTPPPAAPAAPTTPTAPTPSTPAQSTTPATTPSSTPASTPSSPAPTTPTKQQSSGSSSGGTTTPTTTKDPVITPKDAFSVSLWQQILAGQLPIIGIVSLGVLGAVLIGLGIAHRALFIHALATSEKYVMHHPFIDAGVVATAALLILMTTVGRIN